MIRLGDQATCDMLPSLEGEDGNAVAVLIPQADPAGTGELVWVPEEESIERNIIGQKMRMMVPMLNDSTRNEYYDDAIRKAVCYCTERLGRPPVVLDIGAGTGFLSLCGARAGASKVFACEMISSVANVARKIIESNGLQDVISVINKRSDEIILGEDIPLGLRFDLIVTETLDSSLLDEGILESLGYAMIQFCTSDVIVVPDSARVKGIVMGCEGDFKYINSTQMAFDKNKVVFNNGTSHYLKNTHVNRSSTCFALSKPFEIFTFDFQQPDQKSRTAKVCPIPTADGTARFVVMYWDLTLFDRSVVGDKKKRLFEDQSPPHVLSTDYNIEESDARWQDHWFPVIVPLGQNMLIQKMNLEFVHDSDSINLVCVNQQENILSSKKAAQLARRQDSEDYLKRLKDNFIKLKTNDEIWDVSDGPFLALNCVESGFRVTTFETRSSWFKYSSDICQNTNIVVTSDLPSCSKNISILLVSDLIYESMEPDPVLCCFTFWYQSKRAQSLVDKLYCFPRSCKIMATLFHFPKLSETMKPPQHVLNFDHSKVSSAWEEHDKFTSIGIWNYQHIRVANEVVIASLDFQDQKIHSEATCRFVLNSESHCRLAFVLYVDSICDVGWETVQLIHFFGSQKLKTFGNSIFKFERTECEVDDKEIVFKVTTKHE